jgi:SPRY domain
VHVDNLETCSVGVEKDGHTLDAPPGSDSTVDGVGYISGAGNVMRRTVTPSGPHVILSPYGQGDTIGVVLDLTSNTVQFYLNGTQEGAPIQISPGIYFAACAPSQFEGRPAAVLTGNFSSNAPTGVATWDEGPSIEPDPGVPIPGVGTVGAITTSGVSWAANLPWITVSNNADWNESFNVRDGLGPADLTDVTFRMQMRSLGGNIAFIDAGALPGEMVVNGNPHKGAMTIRIPAERLRGIPPSVYVRDIIMLRGGERIYAGRGQVTVIRGITSLYDLGASTSITGKFISGIQL